MEDDECPVCFIGVKDAGATLRPCMHTFCVSCARRALSLSARCPLCRGTPFELLSGAICVPAHSHLKVCVLSDAHPYPGITLTNAVDGVRVLRVDRRDAAYAHGFRKDDVISEVNGIPCRTHQDVIRVWDEASRHARDHDQCVILRCTVRGRTLARVTLRRLWSTSVT